MRINVFTPLPDAPTEIANLAARVLPALGEIAEVRAWTMQATWRDGLAENYEIIRFDPATCLWRMLNWADVNIYHIGNSHLLHRWIFDLSRQIPGLQILHDISLEDFAANFIADQGPDRETFLSEMRRSGLETEARQLIAGAMTLPLFMENGGMAAMTLRAAIAGVVHNRAVLDRLATLCETPLFYLPLCLTHPLGHVPDRRRREPADERPARLVAFGFMGRNRCLPEILHALAAMPRPDRFRLDIFGHLEEEPSLRALVADLGLDTVATLRGFVSDAELDAALADAELALNLRNPTMGEASASQLRIWANALPSLVSDTGWYATLPRDAVFAVAPGREVPEIQLHLHALLADPSRYRDAGLRGRRIVERNHQPADYATALLRIAAQAQHLHARRTATVMARRVAAALLGVAEPPLVERFISGAASAIVDLTGYGTGSSRGATEKPSA